jgi:hypothetical protein
LVVCLFGAVICGLSVAGMAVAVGWGLLAGFLLYSGVGSSTLVVLALALPERDVALASTHRRPAFA